MSNKIVVTKISTMVDIFLRARYAGKPTSGRAWGI